MIQTLLTGPDYDESFRCELDFIIRDLKSTRISSWNALLSKHERIEKAFYNHVFVITSQIRLMQSVDGGEPRNIDDNDTEAGSNLGDASQLEDGGQAHDRVEHVQVAIRSDESKLPEEIEFDPLALIPISVLDLSVRSQNGLMRAGIINMRLLADAKEQQLLGIRKLGQKSVEEILAKRASFIARLKGGAVYPDDVARTMGRLSAYCQDADYFQILQEKPALRELSDLLHSRGLDLKSLFNDDQVLIEVFCREPAMLKRLGGELQDVSTVDFPQSMLKMFYLVRFLEMDSIIGLVDAVFSGLKVRERTVLLGRTGIAGKGKKTLEHLGQSLGVTRERIRQIEVKARRRVWKDASPGTLFGVGAVLFALVYNHGGLITRNELVRMLEDQYSPDGAIDTGCFIDFVIEVYKPIILMDVGLLAIHDNKDVGCKIMTAARDYLSGEGDVRSSEEIISAIRVQFKGSLIGDPGALNQALQSCIDQDQAMIMVSDGRIGLVEWPHINPQNRKDMIISAMRRINGPAHFRAITQKVNLMFGTSYPDRNIHSALSLYPEDFIWIGQKGMYDLAERGAVRVDSYIELVNQALENSGVPMGVQDIYKFVAQYRVSKVSSLMMTLAYNPQYFISLPGGLYGLTKWNLSTSPDRTSEQSRNIDPGGYSGPRDILNEQDFLDLLQ